MADERLLADVIGALRLAGLTQRPDMERDPGGFSASLDVEWGQDRVSVIWSCSHVLRDRFREAVEAGTDFTVTGRMSGGIDFAMIGAIAEILRLSGFEVRMSTWDLEPGVLEVLGRTA